MSTQVFKSSSAAGQQSDAQEDQARSCHASKVCVPGGGQSYNLITNVIAITSKITQKH